MRMNKQQTCGFFGWRAKEFDEAVAKGFPARKRSSSRGQDWQVDSREAVEWVVEQETGGPRRRPMAEAPLAPGFEALAQLDNPVEHGFVAAHLDAVCHLPRLVASLAVGLGVPMATAYELSHGVWLMLAEHVAADMREARFEPWASAADPDIYDLRAFAPINWPNLARKAGEPDWVPPVFGGGWVELTPEDGVDDLDR